MNDLTCLGYVIKTVPYHENDLIVTILTIEGIVTFKARGCVKITNKNASSCLLYAYSEFELSEKNNHYILTRGSLISSNYHLYDDLDKMCLLGLISESLLTFVKETNAELFIIFNYLIKAVQGEFDIFTIAAIFFAKIIINCGYGLEVNQCVICHKKTNIVSLDYDLGGFICLKCLRHQHIESATYLKTMRYIFNVDEKKYFHHRIEKKLAIRIIHELKEYLKNKFEFRKLVFFELFDSLY